MRRKAIVTIVIAAIVIVLAIVIGSCAHANNVSKQAAREQAEAAQQAEDEQLQRASGCVQAALRSDDYSKVEVKSGGFSWIDGQNSTSYEHFSFTAEVTDKQGYDKTMSYDMRTASSKNYLNPAVVTYVSNDELSATDITSDVQDMADGGYSTDDFASHLAGNNATDSQKRNATVRANACAAANDSSLLDLNALNSKLAEVYSS